METIIYQYYRYFGSTFDTYHIRDPLVRVAHAGCLQVTELSALKAVPFEDIFEEENGFVWRSITELLVIDVNLFYNKKGRVFFDWPVYN